MTSTSALRAQSRATAAGHNKLGNLLDECFAAEYGVLFGQLKRRRRQVLLRVTLAQLSRDAALSPDVRLHGLCAKSPTRVLAPRDQLFSCLAALRDRKALKILAEPVFCVQSGTPAHAHFTGGEFPTLSPIHARPASRHPAMQLAFQRYGTDLEVTPRVLPDRTLRVTLAVRQTCPDAGSGRRIGDVLLPGLSVRAAVADAEMPCGRTLLLYAPAEEQNSYRRGALLVLATARLVRQGAATDLHAPF